MPLPLLFIGAAVIMSATGTGLSTKAGFDQSHAKKLNDCSNQRIDNAAIRLDYLKKHCSLSLQNLGEEKIFVLNGSIKTFLDVFRQLKNVDFTDSVGLIELHKLHIDHKEFDKLEEMSKFSFSLAEGVSAGATGGVLTVFGAYGATASLASASTGTAIATLHGVAATNATLAWFGGGSLAAGGAGMAGGAAVLGGIVAGPALLVMGIITGAKAGKNLENAKANAAKTNEICEQFENGALQCIAIRRRTNMFYNLLTRLDAYLMPLVYDMENIIRNEGTDYSVFSAESKKIIACAASAAVTVKTVIDTPILSADGSLTEACEKVAAPLLLDMDKKEKQMSIE